MSYFGVFEMIVFYILIGKRKMVPLSLLIKASPTKLHSNMQEGDIVDYTTDNDRDVFTLMIYLLIIV